MTVVYLQFTGKIDFMFDDSLYCTSRYLYHTLISLQDGQLEDALYCRDWDMSSTISLSSYVNLNQASYKVILNSLI